MHFLPELLDEPERALFLEIFHSDKRYYPDLSFFKIDFFVQSILECMNMEKPLQPLALKSRLVSLLSQIYRIHSKNALQPVPGDERIQAVLQYLNDNLLEPLSLDELSRKFHISKNHLNVIFRHETGTTINQYVRIKRLSKAQNEIMAGCPTEEAAFKAGFNDYSNFYRAYKAFFGTLPSAPVIGGGDTPDDAIYPKNFSKTTCIK
jgi:AraC-like DNA-binding protein